VRPRFHRPLGATLILAALAYALTARGDVVGEQIRLQLLSPAISGDGKTVAVASLDPGGVAGAVGSLALYDLGGNLKRRLPLTAAERDPERARRDYAAAQKVLDAGGYRRLGRLRQQSEHTIVHRRIGDPSPRFATVLSQGELGITVIVADRKLRVEAMRASRRLGPWTLQLATPAAACPAIGGYVVSPARAGLAGRTLVLSVFVTTPDGSTCFSHEAVLTLK